MVTGAYCNSAGDNMFDAVNRPWNQIQYAMSSAGTVHWLKFVQQNSQLELYSSDRRSYEDLYERRDKMDLVVCSYCGKWFLEETLL